MSLHKMSLLERQQLIQSAVGHDLTHIKAASYPLESVIGRNCEQVIGVTQVPLGVAGLLRLIRGQQEMRTYVPLATTEGALIASINRGCKATFNKGIRTLVEKVGTTRGPHLKVDSIYQGKEIVEWIKNHWKRLEKTAKATSEHLHLLDFQWQLFGSNLYLRFVFNTDEAMGMNMVTVATEALLREIGDEFHTDGILSGNFCIDKKPAFSTLLGGRGKKVWAETVITKQTVESVLKTSPSKIVEVVLHKQLLGSIAAGSLGFNAHFANIIAALFLATGQDMAHVVEGSLGVTTAELRGEDLYFSVYLPALMVGTVGGGTGLPTQHEALEILGLTNHSLQDDCVFAEIIAATVLSGELSLTAALANNSLAKAHQIHGQGKK